LLAGGHVLLEGVPGTGKTLTAKAVGAVCGAGVSRIQFTPDLMPSDLVGAAVYDAALGGFRLKKGPVFADLVLADEINRAPAKTQSALLEAMQEKRVSIDGQTYELSPSFFVMATQNPIEMEGTYPLPEAELDRFAMKILLPYPELEAEKALLGAVRDGRRADILDLGGLAALWGAGELEAMKALAREVAVDDSLLAYIAAIVRATRTAPGVEVGCSPRSGVILLATARVRAASEGRGYVVPDDVKGLAPAVLSHRLVPLPEAELEGFDPYAVIKAVLDATEAPR
jgi:MoxR-like ATPase